MLLEEPRPAGPQEDDVPDVLAAAPPPPEPEPRPFWVRSMPLSGLFLLASFYILHAGRVFFLPIVLAILLSFLLRPVVRGLKRLWLPSGLAAGLILLALLGGFGFALYELAGPAYGWVENAPQSLRKIERRLRDLKKPVQTVSRATEQVARIAQVGGAAATQTVAVQAPTWGEKLWKQTVHFATGGAVVFVLLFFLLTFGDRLLAKLARFTSGPGEEERWLEVARQIEREISSYLATVTLINVVKGVLVWGLCLAFGLPNPVLWGALACVLNYVPYLGPLATMIVLAAVGLLTFDDLGRAFLVPLIFWVLDLIEAYFFTPLVLGRRFTLNPVLLFVGLTFWGWVWGIAGALLAVPILVVTKILCDRSTSFGQFGELLGS